MKTNTDRNQITTPQFLSQMCHASQAKHLENCPSRAIEAFLNVKGLLAISKTFTPNFCKLLVRDADVRLMFAYAF